jgi:hypothetical protein
MPSKVRCRIRPIDCCNRYAVPVSLRYTGICNRELVYMLLVEDVRLEPSATLSLRARMVGDISPAVWSHAE